MCRTRGIAHDCHSADSGGAHSTCFSTFGAKWTPTVIARLLELERWITMRVKIWSTGGTKKTQWIPGSPMWAPVSRNLPWNLFRNLLQNLFQIHERVICSELRTVTPDIDKFMSKD